MGKLGVAQPTPPIIPVLLANPYLTFIVAGIQKTRRKGSDHWAGMKGERRGQTPTTVEVTVQC